MAKIIPFSGLPASDLFVDAVYEGGRAGNTSDDPISKLMRTGNQGGFRKVGTNTTRYVVLYSSLEDRDWPDSLDIATGLFTYYGDNKEPGRQLHESSRGGNSLLQRVFEQLHKSPPDRRAIPPFFVFTKSPTQSARSIRFRGIAAPGGAGIPFTDDLVAVWKSFKGERFQNYRSLFTILDEPFIKLGWLDDLKKGNLLSTNCPDAWRRWVYTGIYQPLTSQPTIQYRTLAEQLPQTRLEHDIIVCIYTYFKDNPTDFEKCAAALVCLSDPNLIVDTITRPVVDGGRDAIGRYKIGPAVDPIYLDFALEAKCYSPGLNGESLNPVGVKETSRLISRLRHRQFGILVTTSAIGKQAYEEIRNDAHPVILLSAKDITAILISKGFNTRDSVCMWLQSNFPK